MHTLSDGVMVYFWFSGIATGASIAVLVIRVMSLPRRGQHSKTDVSR